MPKKRSTKKPNLPTPYYQDDAVTIYHGDCRELLPLFDEEIDLVLTDPPYGVDHDALHGANGSKMWGKTRIAGDSERFDPEHLLSFDRLVIWGANNFASRLPESAGWLVWNKSPAKIRQGFVYSHSELAWTNLMGHVENIDLVWEGASRQGERFFHPTQKPLVLMGAVLERFVEKDDATILDPYCGAGSTLLAARSLGYRSIGIELERRWCDIAVRRIKQGTLLGG